jgi:hypothetical protein
MDDLAHQSFLQAKLAGGLEHRAWWDMFRLVDGDPERLRVQRSSGLVPWWTHLELEVAFLRPVTVISHYLDAWAWPDRPVLMHLHSLLIYGGVCLLVVRLFEALPIATTGGGGESQPGPARAVSFVLAAGLIFAVDYSHADPVAWVAQRNALLATGFGVLAMLWHHRWRSRGAWPFAVASVAALVLSLLSGELGVSTVALVVAYAVTIERSAWLQRASSVAPVLCTTILWRVVYDTMGFGAHGSGAYVDPVRSPQVFASLLPERLLALVSMKWAAPVRLVWIHQEYPGLFWLCFALGLAALAAIVVSTARSARHDTHIRFWALSFVLCLVPLVASTPGDSLLFFASVPSAALVGAAIITGWRRGTRSGRAAALVIALVHGALSAAVLLVVSWAQGDKSVTGSAFAHAAELDDERLPGQTLIIVNAPSCIHGQMVPLMREAAGLHRPSFTYVLGASDEPVIVSRIDERTLELHSGAGYLQEPFSAFYRGPDAPLRLNEEIETLAFLARPVELDGHGRPRRVHFRFERAPGHASMRIVTWDGSDYVLFTLPEPGESVRVGGFFGLGH